jgi:Ring finger domain
MSNNIYNEGDLYKKRYVFKFIDTDTKSPINKVLVSDETVPQEYPEEICAHPKGSTQKGRGTRVKVSIPEGRNRPSQKAKGPKKSLKSKDLSKKDEDLTCAICIDEIRDKSFKLGCGHTFHRECLKGLVKKECPLCRRLIKKLPDDISESIEENMESYRIERQEEIANEDLSTIIADDNLMRTMLLLYSIVCDMG